MNYTKLYRQLISTANARNTNLQNFELHHIKPKCHGGKDDKSNLVKLTFREHYLAHRLLVKIHPNDKYLSKALWMMTITTIAALDNIETKDVDCRLTKRINSILENKKTKITTHEYAFSKKQYLAHMIGHEVTDQTKQLISKNTKTAMLNADTLKKCALGSKGTKHYYDKTTLKAYKWFPGDPEIDHTKYSYGRPPMSSEQKKKLSNLKLLNKSKYHNDKLQLSIEIYNDYIKKVPPGWQEKRKDYKNNKLFRSILHKIKNELLKDNIFFNNIFTYTPAEITRKKRILNPVFFEIFDTMLLNWKTNKNVVFDIVSFIKKNLQFIDKKTKEYLNSEKDR